MAAEENQQQAVAAGGGGTSGGTSKLVVIASLVNMVATLGIIAVLMISHQKEKSTPTVQDIVSGQAKGGHGEAKGGHGEAKEGHGEASGGHGDAKSGHGDAGVSDSGKIIPLEPFTVNLTTGVGTHPRYVRMNVSIELEQGVADKEFDVKLPRVRDTIINLLNSKRANEINAVEARERLKDDIKRAVNGFMVQSKVKGVYFTNFAISN
ncbi:MAG: flagellar basal body-associated FliL family protein [Bdellovibrionota bacterium]